MDAMMPLLAQFREICNQLVCPQDSGKSSAPMPATHVKPTSGSYGGGNSRGKLSVLSQFAEGEFDLLDLEYGPLLGTGCTAQVFQGSWKGKPVAIKSFTKPISKMSARMVTDLTRELVILRSVKHNNLLRMVGILPNDPVEIVTEFCAGGSCFDLLNNAEEIELSWPQTEKICADTAAGVHYLHSFQPQIIHRDLKSLNMLLVSPVRKDTDVPQVKVCDFGQSCFLDHRELDMYVGTDRWQAPEVCVHGNYDEKVDVYSFAMVMFETLSSEAPFEDECDSHRIRQLVRAGGRPDLEAVHPECPPKLRQLMIDCWQHDPCERPSFQVICDRLNL